MKLNIVKTGFFILPKGYKNCSVFINFCFSFYKDDFYIFILIRSLKVGLIRFNVLKKGISKLNFYKFINYQQSEVLKRVNIGDNSFKDSNS